MGLSFPSSSNFEMVCHFEKLFVKFKIPKKFLKAYAFRPEISEQSHGLLFT